MVSQTPVVAGGEYFNEPSSLIESQSMYSGEIIIISSENKKNQLTSGRSLLNHHFQLQRNFQSSHHRALEIHPKRIPVFSSQRILNCLQVSPLQVHILVQI